MRLRRLVLRLRKRLLDQEAQEGVAEGLAVPRRQVVVLDPGRRTTTRDLRGEVVTAQANPAQEGAVKTKLYDNGHKEALKRAALVSRAYRSVRDWLNH